MRLLLENLRKKEGEISLTDDASTCKIDLKHLLHIFHFSFFINHNNKK